MAQLNLNHEETKNSLVPKLPKDLQRDLKDAVHEFHAFYKKSIDLHIQAENLLMQRAIVAPATSEGLLAIHDFSFVRTLLG